MGILESWASSPNRALSIEAHHREDQVAQPGGVNSDIGIHVRGE